MPVTTTRNLKPGTSVTRNAQDKRGDRDTLPWYASGAANTALGIEEAIEAAVLDAGGWDHKSKAYSEDDGPRLLSANGTWFGNGQVFGTFDYARGPADCQPKHASSVIGYIEAKGTVGAAIEEIGSGNSCDFEGISVTSTVKRRAATEHISMPCVWVENRPRAADTQVINSADYTIDGVIYPAYTLRFDGFQTEPYDGRFQVSHKGTINWTYLAGGWKHHRVYCVKWVSVPPQGNQTIGGAILQISTVQVYQYPAVAFPTLAEICPNCYGAEAES